MLVITRKPNEKIRIGDQIEVIVKSVRGQNVRLGIEAPDECHILRSELTKKDEGVD